MLGTFKDVLSAVGSIFGSDTPIGNIVNKVTNNDLTAAEKLQLEQALNQDANNARDREIEMARVNPEGNWPMYTMAYVACGMWVLINVGLFFNDVLQTLVQDIVGFDKYCIAGIGAYFFASRFFRGEK